MTYEEASNDPRKNVLLQCVGASKNVVPQLLQGKVKANSVFMFCSDGFRHVLSDEEMFDCFNPSKLVDLHAMEEKSRYLIDLVKSRQEKDNITVALLKSI